MDGKKEQAPDADEQAWREHREALLDEALEQSFPASDPPSIATSPGADQDPIASDRPL